MAIAGKIRNQNKNVRVPKICTLFSESFESVRIIDISLLSIPRIDPSYRDGLESLQQATMTDNVER